MSIYPAYYSVSGFHLQSGDLYRFDKDLPFLPIFLKMFSYPDVIQHKI